MNFRAARPFHSSHIIILASPPAHTSVMRGSAIARVLSTEISLPLI
jgi:hypothetical protein